MKCYNCGNEVTTEGTNCPFCGSPLSPAAGNQQGYNQQTSNVYNSSNASIDPKTASIICYITWIGFLVALLASDKNHPFLKHHLNNALIILIGGVALGLVCVIPILGWLAAAVGEVFLFVCAIMGIVGAINEQQTELPLIGQIKLIQ